MPLIVIVCLLSDEGLEGGKYQLLGGWLLILKNDAISPLIYRGFLMPFKLSEHCQSSFSKPGKISSLTFSSYSKVAKQNKRKYLVLVIHNHEIYKDRVNVALVAHNVNTYI